MDVSALVRLMKKLFIVLRSVFGGKFEQECTIEFYCRRTGNSTEFFDAMLATMRRLQSKFGSYVPTVYLRNRDIHSNSCKSIDFKLIIKVEKYVVSKKQPHKKQISLDN